MNDLEARARALLASDRVTEPTRRALTRRLDSAPRAATVLSAPQFAVLKAVAARLVPLGDLQERADLAGRLDAWLGGSGAGWRYAEMPRNAAAMSDGLAALDREAGLSGFAALSAEAQDELLARVQRGAVESWPFPAGRWFEDLLASLIQLAYGHPLVQLSIGYEGMADAHGFQSLGAGGA